MPKPDDDVDGLFQLPLDQFIAARKSLAAQLKKSGHGQDAERVKLLTKPPISAWAVNQLYWNHRELFDELMSSGQRFRKAQTSGKVPDMRDALNARREALTELSDLATTLLSDAGHNPSLDTIRRITSTLEAVSAFSVLPDDATLGRLTKDVDPPGFGSLGSFMPTGKTSGSKTAEPVATAPNSHKKSALVAPKTKPKSSADNSRALEESRQRKLSTAKASLQNAKKTLTAALAKTESLESQQKKADAAAKETEKQRRAAEKQSHEAEVRFKRASSAAEAAIRRAQTIRDELVEAKETFEDAQRTVEKETKELESLFRSGRNE